MAVNQAQGVGLAQRTPLHPLRAFRGNLAFRRHRRREPRPLRGPAWPSRGLRLPGRSPRRAGARRGRLALCNMPMSGPTLRKLLLAEASVTAAPRPLHRAGAPRLARRNEHQDHRRRRVLLSPMLDAVIIAFTVNLSAGSFQAKCPRISAARCDARLPGRPHAVRRRSDRPQGNDPTCFAARHGDRAAGRGRSRGSSLRRVGGGGPARIGRGDARRARSAPLLAGAERVAEHTGTRGRMGPVVRGRTSRLRAVGWPRRFGVRRYLPLGRMSATGSEVPSISTGALSVASADRALATRLSAASWLDFEFVSRWACLSFARASKVLEQVDAQRSVEVFRPTPVFGMLSVAAELRAFSSTDSPDSRH